MSAHQGPTRFASLMREITTGSFIISVIAVALALFIGAVLIVVTNPAVQESVTYFFARPSDTFEAIGEAISGAYSAMFRGAVYNYFRPTFWEGIRPFTETLTFATPLIAAGLGVGVAFRAGLFNIGGRGQMLIAAACAGYVGFAWELPFGVHLLVALVAGVVGGAIWGGIVGLLRARTGAHEVIVTIMLNYVAFYLVSYLLRTPGALQAPGSNNPKTPAIAPTAVLPDLLGPGYPLHLGFLLVVGVTIFVWWLLSRSTFGFELRVVGENPNAARVAGMSVGKIYTVVMLISGGLVGLAGVNQVLGTVTTGFGAGIDAGIGFDAITVALLGRSRAWGIFAAGILFGALRAGGFAMQAAESIPVDIVLVVQSLVVLFIAAPPLLRALFRLPKPGKAIPGLPNVMEEVGAK